MSISVKQKPNFTRVAKNCLFATASALTKTAKDAQKEVIGGLPDKFTVRSGWAQPGNKFGIRIKPATKTDLLANVNTQANWLEKFETGEDKTARDSGNLAIPTENVRRTKRQIIQRSQRPGALRGKKDVVLKTKNGLVLFQRRGRGKNKKLVALYNLSKRAKIRKNSPVYEPVRRTVKKNFSGNFRAALSHAFRTAK